jgi:hypothetical protein
MYEYSSPISALQLPDDFQRVIYVVHWYYFKELIIQEIKGKANMYAFQGDENDDETNIKLYPPFPLYNAFISNIQEDILSMKRSHYYYTKVFNNYNLCRTLIRNIRQGLIDSKGIGKIKFTFRCAYEDLIYLERLSIGFSTTRSNGRSFIQHNADGIIRNNIPSLLICFVIMQVDILLDVLGEDFFYYPICDHNFVSGNLRHHIYATIDPLNAKMMFFYDMNTMDLTVQADVIQDELGSILTKIDMNNNKVKNNKDLYEGYFLFNIKLNQYYYCVLYEYNDEDFVIGNKKKVPIAGEVAWILPISDHGSNYYEVSLDCLNDRKVLLNLCTFISIANMNDYEVVPEEDVVFVISKKKGLKRKTVEQRHLELEDDNDWQITPFKKKDRNILPGEENAVLKLIEVCRLYDSLDDRFDYSNRITKYILRDFQRINRTSNFEISDSMKRNINCFHLVEPRKTIIEMFSHWPFLLSPSEIEIISDDKRPKRFAKKEQMVEYAVNCLIAKGDWDLEVKETVTITRSVD